MQTVFCVRPTCLWGVPTQTTKLHSVQPGRLVGLGTTDVFIFHMTTYIKTYLKMITKVVAHEHTSKRGKLLHSVALNNIFLVHPLYIHVIREAIMIIVNVLAYWDLRLCANGLIRLTAQFFCLRQNL